MICRERVFAQLGVFVGAYANNRLYASTTPLPLSGTFFYYEIFNCGNLIDRCKGFKDDANDGRGDNY